jgi:hypothetical protein
VRNKAGVDREAGRFHSYGSATADARTRRAVAGPLKPMVYVDCTTISLPPPQFRQFAVAVGVLVCRELWRQVPVFALQVRGETVRRNKPATANHVKHGGWCRRR